MKKALKVIAIIFGVLFVGFAIVSLLIIKKLPSPWEIKQVIAPKKVLSPEFAPPNSSPTAAGEKDTSPQPQADKAAKTQEAKVEDGKARGLQILKEDFMNEQKALSTVCMNLATAEQSRFLRKDESGSADEFTKSLTDPNRKDPLVESAVPVLRYVFRVEGMRALVDLIEKADAENDQGIFKKAEFYTKLGIAAQTVRSNKANIDRILMKSYNLFVLSKAVGKHPELARDPATLSFCDQIEKNLNMNLEFNADEQAAEMQKFLDYAKVDPKEVDFDPSYRSDVKFDISASSLQLNHIWIEKLFEKDIAKARKHLKKDSTEAPAPSDY